MRISDLALQCTGALGVDKRRDAFYPAYWVEVIRFARVLDVPTGGGLPAIDASAQDVEAQTEVPLWGTAGGRPVVLN